jgi:hypothetical protein
MNLGTILIVLLVLMLGGVVPTWPHDGVALSSTPTPE